jgi:hypothetical protein
VDSQPKSADSLVFAPACRYFATSLANPKFSL